MNKPYVKKMHKPEHHHSKWLKKTGGILSLAGEAVMLGSAALGQPEGVVLGETLIKGGQFAKKANKLLKN
jgi:hypothetical protein